MGQNGETALHAASKAGELEAVKFLAEKCADIDLDATDQVVQSALCLM